MYFLQTEKFTFEQMQNYQVSVIEREVNQGIVAQDFTKMTSLAFLRRIDQMNMSDTRGGRKTLTILGWEPRRRSVSQPSAAKKRNSLRNFFFFNPTFSGEGRQPRCFVDLEGKSTTKADEEAMALAEKVIFWKISYYFFTFAYVFDNFYVLKIALK